MARPKGIPEKKSEAKAIAARENAHAPRPAARRSASAGEEATLIKSLRALRKLTPQAVEILKAAMVCGDPAVCVRAAEAVLDRSGIPRQQHQLVDLTLGRVPKMVMLGGFRDPPGYDDDAPTDSHAEIIEAPHVNGGNENGGPAPAV